jgi:hypothetical protein
MRETLPSRFVHVVLADGTELFGVQAFPFRRGQVEAVAFDLPNGERRAVTEHDGTFQVLDPAASERLPSAALWLQANDDSVLRSAIKDRCRL